jgi:hypothetical protein
VLPASVPGKNRVLRKRDYLSRPFWECRTQALDQVQTDRVHLQPLQPTADLPLPDAPGQGGAGELVDLALAFLLRQYLVIVFMLLLGGVAGAIFLVVRPPTYTASAKILIGTQRPQFIQQQSLFAETPLDQSQMESQRNADANRVMTECPKPQCIP